MKDTQLYSDAETSAVRTSIENYVLGNSAQEQKRLRLQASFLEKWTEQFLLSAGLKRGMRVLDFGCGMGDVSLLAAKLVGTTGHVTGIDRDVVVIEKARERARFESRGADIQFIQSDLFDFHRPRKFDAVIGRYVLLYQPNPAAAISHAANQLRSGGIVVFHEMDLANQIRSCPETTLFGTMQMLVAETFRRGGFWTDLGLHLTRLFLDAGLPWPTIKAEVPVGGEPGSFIYQWMTETLRSLLPRIEQFGLANAGELDLDTLVARMDAEAVASRSQISGPLQFGAWSRKL
ncbi:MAG: class I SAM-dependent methyltransferase [Acidobacteriaceae bacterium]|nr:class I SAM-dependent methyltransferase [Acidobacteriaceae bacterium]